MTGQIGNTRQTMYAAVRKDGRIITPRLVSGAAKSKRSTHRIPHDDIEPNTLAQKELVPTYTASLNFRTSSASGESASSISLSGSRLDLCRGPEVNHLALVLNEAIYKLCLLLFPESVALNGCRRDGCG
jgi:hypothetical protein